MGGPHSAGRKNPNTAKSWEGMEAAAKGRLEANEATYPGGHSRKRRKIPIT